MSRHRLPVAARLCVLLLLPLASCSEGGDDGSETTTLRAVSGGGAPGFNALVSFAAWKILEEEGLTVEHRYLEDGPTAVQAITQGEAEIGVDIAINVGVPAVEAGADIVDVVATQRLTWAMAAAPDITSMEELEGRKIAVHAEASFTNAVADYFAEQYGYDFEKLIIPGSEVRAEALAQGQIDASILDLADIVQLSAEYPGTFGVLMTIGEVVPELIEQDVWLDRTWAEENPELATKVVKAVVTAARRLDDDATWALETAQEYLPDTDPAILEELVAEYQERELWPDDGLMTEERALDTLEFYNELGEIEIEVGDAALDKYFDFDYLDSALAELG